MESGHKNDLATKLLGLERTAPVSNPSCVPIDVVSASPRKKWRFLATVALVEVIGALAIILLSITLTRETTCPAYEQTPSPTVTLPPPTEPITLGIDLSSKTPVTWHPLGRPLNGFESCGDASSCVGLALSSNGQVLVTTVPGGKNASTDDATVTNANTFPVQIQAYSLDHVTTSWVAKGSAISLCNDYCSIVKPVVSIDGNIVAVSQTPRVRIFRFDNDTNMWSEMGSGILRSNQPNHGFGTPVLAMSSDGSILAVGDSLENTVRVFRFNGSDDWTQLGQTLSVGEMFAHHNFGSSVALSESGGILAVLASGGTNQGYMKVFALESDGWAEKIYYSAEFHFPRLSGHGSVTEMGSSVALSGDGLTAAVSLENRRGLSHAVKVFSFDVSFRAWDLVEEDMDLAMDGDFPVNVALSSDGSVLAVTSSQRVTVFGYNSTIGDWENISALSVDTTKNTYFSLALSKDATTIATAYTQRKIPHSPVIDVFRARQP